MKNWKRNTVIAGMMVVACAGIYLNWLYNDNTPELTQALDADKILGESTLVIQDDSSSVEAVATQPQSSSKAESFAQMRLSRQTAREEAVELLQETIAYAEGGDTGTSSAQLERIIADALTESQIESLVVAKGYSDCVAYINEDGISLAVAAPETGLQQSDVACVSDIVLSQTDFTLSDIRIFGVE